MRLSALVQALAADLAALGALGDDTTADVARRLGAAMVGPISARVLEAVSEIAADLGSSLPGGRVEVRLSGADVELVFVEADGRDEHEPAQPEADGDMSARITLRLPAPLKARIEAASGREGVSVNTWIVRALGQSSRPDRGPGGGRRLSGYGRS